MGSALAARAAHRRARICADRAGGGARRLCSGEAGRTLLGSSSGVASAGSVTPTQIDICLTVAETL